MKGGRQRVRERKRDLQSEFRDDLNDNRHNYPKWYSYLEGYRLAQRIPIINKVFFSFTVSSQ